MYRVRAAGCSALFVLVVDLGHEGAAQQVVPLGASLLRTVDVSQADLGSRLEGRTGGGGGDGGKTGQHGGMSKSKHEYHSFGELNENLSAGCKTRTGDSTNQTFFVTRLAGVADVDPQGLLPQCTVGYLHAEHLVDLHHVLRKRAACSEQAAGGFHAGQHHRTHIPAGDARYRCYT